MPVAGLFAERRLAAAGDLFAVRDLAQNGASPPQATCLPSDELSQNGALPPQATAPPSADCWQNGALAPQATALPLAETWQKAGALLLL